MNRTRNHTHTIRPKKKVLSARQNGLRPTHSKYAFPENKEPGRRFDSFKLYLQKLGRSISSTNGCCKTTQRYPFKDQRNNNQTTPSTAESIFNAKVTKKTYTE
jgi:hypothetical protein